MEQTPGTASPGISSPAPTQHTQPGGRANQTVTGRVAYVSASKKSVLVQINNEIPGTDVRQMVSGFVLLKEAGTKEVNDDIIIPRNFRIEERDLPNLAGSDAAPRKLPWFVF